MRGHRMSDHANRVATARPASCVVLIDLWRPHRAAGRASDADVAATESLAAAARDWAPIPCLCPRLRAAMADGSYSWLRNAALSAAGISADSSVSERSESASSPRIRSTACTTWAWASEAGTRMGTFWSRLTASVRFRPAEPGDARPSSSRPSPRVRYSAAQWGSTTPRPLTHVMKR